MANHESGEFLIPQPKPPQEIAVANFPELVERCIKLAEQNSALVTQNATLQQQVAELSRTVEQGFESVEKANEFAVEMESLKQKRMEKSLSLEVIRHATLNSKLSFGLAFAGLFSTVPMICYLSYLWQYQSTWIESVRWLIGLIIGASAHKLITMLRHSPNGTSANVKSHANVGAEGELQ